METSENRFKCHICSKTSKTKQNLDKHVRTHTGEKPFKCDICNKSFAVKSSHIKELIQVKNHLNVIFVERNFLYQVI